MVVFFVIIEFKKLSFKKVADIVSNKFNWENDMVNNKLQRETVATSLFFSLFFIFKACQHVLPVFRIHNSVTVEVMNVFTFTAFLIISCEQKHKLMCLRKKMGLYEQCLRQQCRNSPISSLSIRMMTIYMNVTKITPKVPLQTHLCTYNCTTLYLKNLRKFRKTSTGIRIVSPMPI